MTIEFPDPLDTTIRFTIADVNISIKSIGPIIARERILMPVYDITQKELIIKQG